MKIISSEILRYTESLSQQPKDLENLNQLLDRFELALSQIEESMYGNENLFKEHQVVVANSKYL